MMGWLLADHYSGDKETDKCVDRQDCIEIFPSSPSHTFSTHQPPPQVSVQSQQLGLTDHLRNIKNKPVDGRFGIFWCEKTFKNLETGIK